MAKRLYEEAYIRVIAEKIRSFLKPPTSRRKFTTAQIPEGIQLVYEQGKSDGHNKGFEEGKTRGYEQGFASGRTRGRSEGYDEGYIEGAGFGIERGEVIGYTKGYKDGAEQAIKSIPRAEGVGF